MKYLSVSSLIETRILHGDYMLQPFPTDRALAAELQVDNRTVRKAIDRLVEHGLLVREANGRPQVRRSVNGEARSDRDVALRIALLTVAYPTPFTERWHSALEVACERHHATVRVVGYSHLNDPVVRDTIEAFDGVFFALPPMQLPRPLLATIRAGGKAVVCLDADTSALGIPCLWLASPIYIRRLLDHLADLGHERIMVLSTQPHGEVILQRLEQCRLWLAAHARRDRLVDEPVRPRDSATGKAYEVVRGLLESGDFPFTAVLGTTSAAAKGASRALHEAGLRLGHDVSVCAAEDGGGEAEFLIPSMTCLSDADPQPYLSVCLEWMSRGGKGWIGPMLVQPHDTRLFVGESTGPAPAREKAEPSACFNTSPPNPQKPIRPAGEA